MGVYFPVQPTNSGDGNPSSIEKDLTTLLEDYRLVELTEKGAGKSTTST